jgi:Secretion system C-terminal sorting domain
MKKITKCLFLLVLLPILLQAQYMGGNGRGDVSVILTNVPLPVQKVTEVFPTKYDLEQNYPNPFNPTTKIKYSVPQSSNVVIKVFDVLGNEIETLVNEEKPAGTYEVTWYAEQLPSGVYFYQLKAGSFLQTKKMVLMK